MVITVPDLLAPADRGIRGQVKLDLREGVRPSHQGSLTSLLERTESEPPCNNITFSFVLTSLFCICHYSSVSLTTYTAARIILLTGQTGEEEPGSSQVNLL